MREILVVNPRRKRTTKKRKRRRTAPRKKGVSTMAKKRTTKRRTRRRRRNPENPRRVRKYARKASRALGSSFMGLNFRKALGDILPTQIGMFAAKWGAKRWGDPATEIDPNTWNAFSYAKGAIGGVLAAMAMNMIRRGSGQKVLEGAVNLMIYKAIQNELVVKSEWAVNQFGQDWEDQPYTPDEYLMTGEDDINLPALFGPSDAPMMFAEDGSIVPATDEFRLPEVPMEGYDGLLVRPGRLGYTSPLERPGHLGIDPYDKAFSLIS